MQIPDKYRPLSFKTKVCTCIIFFGGLILVAFVFSFVSDGYSPFWNTHSLIKAEYMAKEYGLDFDANDPNFLRDYREFTGHEYKDPQDNNLW